MFEKKKVQSQQWFVECIAIIVALFTNGKAFSTHFHDKNSAKLYRFCCKPTEEERRQQTNGINFPHYGVICIGSAVATSFLWFVLLFLAICSNKMAQTSTQPELHRNASMHYIVYNELIPISIWIVNNKNFVQFIWNENFDVEFWKLRVTMRLQHKKSAMTHLQSV